MIWKKAKESNVKEEESDTKDVEESRPCMFPIDKKHSCQKCAHNEFVQMGSDPLFSIWLWHCDVSKIRTYDDHYKVWRTWDRCDAFKIAKKCSTCAHYNTIIIGDAEIEREKHLCPSYTNTSICLNWEKNEDIDLPQ